MLERQSATSAGFVRSSALFARGVQPLRAPLDIAQKRARRRPKRSRLQISAVHVRRSLTGLVGLPARGLFGSRRQGVDIRPSSNQRNPMAFELSAPHGLEISDARARLHALADYLSNKYGLTIKWTGEDEANISGSYLVVTISGSLRLTPSNVTFSGKDPGMLWRGKAKEYLGRKLQRYLDPNVALGDLPRR
jgi:hypothetical protein